MQMTHLYFFVLQFEIWIKLKIPNTGVIIHQQSVVLKQVYSE